MEASGNELFELTDVSRIYGEEPVQVLRLDNAPGTGSGIIGIVGPEERLQEVPPEVAQLRALCKKHDITPTGRRKVRRCGWRRGGARGRCGAGLVVCAARACG